MVMTGSEKGKEIPFCSYRSTRHVAGTFFFFKYIYRTAEVPLTTYKARFRFCVKYLMK